MKQALDNNSIINTIVIPEMNQSADARRGAAAKRVTAKWVTASLRALSHLFTPDQRILDLYEWMRV